MKLSLQLQRRRPPRPGPSITLFPFLAVLICTMGALVPLLLAISRTARLQAAAAAEAKAAQQAAQFATEAQTQREDVKWRIEQLKQSRRQTEAQLADARLELGHFEEHSRRLRGQIARYQDTVANVDRLEQADGQQTAQAEAELRQVRGQVEAAERQLDEARRAAAGRTRSYAVVPYEGPNQTRRRPIYIECLAEAVVLQPEGVRLSESDFDGPLGPGNPLAAALRAAREHMLAGRDFDPQAGEPYPMLLVRPEGIAAYYAARAAMKSWGGDFGYELIGDDWKLAYQPPDPRLAAVFRQVIATGRQSEARLAAAAPRQYGRRGAREQVASGEYSQRPGAAVPGGAASGEGSVERGDGGGPGTSVPSSVGRNTGGQGPAAAGGEIAGSPLRSAEGWGGGAVGNPYRSSAQRAGGSSMGSLAGSPSLAGDPSTSSVGNPEAAITGATGSGDQPVGNPGRGDGTRSAPAVPGGPYGSPAGSSVTAAQGGGSGLSPTGPCLGEAGGGQFGAACPHPSPLPKGEGTYDKNPLSKGEGTYDKNPLPKGEGRYGSGALRAPTEGWSGEKTSEGPEGYVAGQPPREREPDPLRRGESADEPPERIVRGRGLRPGEWEPPPDLPPDRPEKKDKDDPADRKGGRHGKSSVDRRGEDWALRDTARGSVGITRPIRVECYANRLVVISDRGPANNRVVPLGKSTESSIDTFISATWGQMESWGMAGRGMYWRPVLQVSVAPDAQQRFAELARLLEGSGLAVERK
jgi:hypothetical protein